MPTEKGCADSVPLSVLRDLGSLRAYGLAARGGACTEGFHPSKPPLGFGVRGSDAPCAGVVERPRAKPSPNLPHLRLGQGKGQWSRASIDPCSSLVYSVARRVNSAAGERVGLDLRERRPRRPVVTACYIDPSTRTERTSFALRLRLRRRSRAAARPSARADTRAPSACFRAQAC